MSTKTAEELFNEVVARLRAVEQKVPDGEGLKRMVGEVIKDLEDDGEIVQEFKRKMRFSQTADPKLAGSKYARLGLTIDDLQYAYGMLRAANVPISDELTNAIKAISPEMVATDTRSAYEIDRKDLQRAFIDTPSYVWSTADELTRGVTYEGSAAYQRALQSLQRDATAMATGDGGFGAELIGVGYATAAWMAPRREDVIFPLIQSFEMRYATEFLPVDADMPEMLFVPERTTDDPGKPYTQSRTGSNRVQVDAKKFAIRQVWSAEMQEDSLIALVAFYRMQQTKSLQFYRDSLLLNADTTDAATGNINSDDQAPMKSPDGSKHYLAADGIRHTALVDNVGQSVDHGGAMISYQSLVNLRSLLIDRGEAWNHDWGHPNNPSDLLYVVTPELTDPLSLMEEVLTMEKYGRAATILNGEIARIGRNPILTTPALNLTAADGKSDAAAPENNVFNQVACFNRRGYVTGARRRVSVDVSKIGRRDQYEMNTYFRIGIGRYTPTGAAAGMKHTALLYNIRK